MRVITNHLRANVIGYLALFVALGGTSYAAVTLRNHSITPIKLNKQRFGGYVRAFASVEANGRIDAASPGARVLVANTGTPGLFEVRWHNQTFVGCSAQAGVRDVPGSGTAGSALAGMLIVSARQGFVTIKTVDGSGAAAPLPYFVDIVCPTP